MGFNLGPCEIFMSTGGRGRRDAADAAETTADPNVTGISSILSIPGATGSGTSDYWKTVFFWRLAPKTLSSAQVFWKVSLDFGCFLIRRG